GDDRLPRIGVADDELARRDRIVRQTYPQMTAATRIDRCERDARAIAARRRRLCLEPGEQPLGVGPVGRAHPDLARHESRADNIEKTSAVSKRRHAASVALERQL